MLHVCLFVCNLAFAPLAQATPAEAPTPLEVERILYERMRHEDNPPAISEILSSRPADPSDASRTPIRFPDPPAQKLTGGAVSVKRLTHKIPKEAKKACDQAAKLVKKHRYTEAAVLLERAVAIDPEFAEAHNDLGAQYMALGRLAEGEQEFRKAIALDPTFTVPRANLAALEYLRGNLVEAEKEARSLLAFAPTNKNARHVLELIAAMRAQQP